MTENIQAKNPPDPEFKIKTELLKKLEAPKPKIIKME
jgi:hypothetical protein